MNVEEIEQFDANAMFVDKKKDSTSSFKEFWTASENDWKKKNSLASKSGSHAFKTAKTTVDSSKECAKVWSDPDSTGADKGIATVNCVANVCMCLGPYGALVGCGLKMVTGIFGSIWGSKKEERPDPLSEAVNEILDRINELSDHIDAKLDELKREMEQFMVELMLDRFKSECNGSITGLVAIHKYIDGYIERYVEICNRINQLESNTDDDNKTTSTSNDEEEEEDILFGLNKLSKDELLKIYQQIGKEILASNIMVTQELINCDKFLSTLSALIKTLLAEKYGPYTGDLENSKKIAALCESYSEVCLIFLFFFEFFCN